MYSSSAVLAANNMSLGFRQQLDSVWQNNLPIVRDRLASLDEFVLAISHSMATPQQCTDAAAIARKFSGSLSVFGYPTGSQMARALEKLLLSTSAPNPDLVRDIVQSIRGSVNM
jgi:hypothetical protein